MSAPAPRLTPNGRWSEAGINLSSVGIAKDIGVTPIRISQIVNGQRAITVDTALRLARYFGTSAAVWLRLQVRYDLEVAETELRERINPKSLLV